MSELLVVAGAAWLAGLMAFLGGVVAHFEGTAESETKDELIHGVVAFGGGILVAAVAFALAPEAIRVLGPVVLTASFLAGGGLFCFLDRLISRSAGSVAQFMAMLTDYVPEAISMGAVFAHDRGLGLLLAVFIGAQNLPEGFNAYREFVAAGSSARRTLTILALVTRAGPLAAWLGHVFLREHVGWTAAIMAFASGGILYLVFQDIAPQARMRRHWLPSIGAVLGFLVGMLGQQAIGHP